MYLLFTVHEAERSDTFSQVLFRSNVMVTITHLKLLPLTVRPWLRTVVVVDEDQEGWLSQVLLKLLLLTIEPHDWLLPQIEVRGEDWRGVDWRGVAWRGAAWSGVSLG